MYKAIWEEIDLAGPKLTVGAFAADDNSVCRFPKQASCKQATRTAKPLPPPPPTRSRLARQTPFRKKPSSVFRLVSCREASPGTRSAPGAAEYNCGS